MGSTSPKQARTMAAAAHNPAFAKRMGIPTSVAKEFNDKDARSGLLSRAMKKRQKAGPVHRTALGAATV